MININSKKGITLISLIITIIVLLILSGTIIFNASLSNDVGKYNNMVADIRLLKDKILIYYNKYNDIPKTDRTTTINETIYYEIDLGKLENITLNYGKEYGNEELTEVSDVYLVNSNLHVYYLKGVEKSGEMVHDI